MKKYLVSGTMGISVHVVVEAESLKQAKKIAMDARNQNFCCQCSRGFQSEWSSSGELDGIPKIESVEEMEDWA